MELSDYVVRHGRLRNWSPLLGALIPIVIAFALIGSVSWLNRHVDIGYTSRWHVPTSLSHDEVRYSIREPIRCEPRAIVLRHEHARRVGSTVGLAMFASETNPPPGYVYVRPQGASCLVAYYDPSTP